ncbi:MAG: hypothetical protein ACYDG4_01350 [Desulfuromonadaceae bacterium]
MQKNRTTYFLFIAVAAILVFAGPASTVDNSRHGEKFLLDFYGRNLSKLETSSFGVPLIVESLELDDRVHVDVYGIFDYRFGSVVNSLKVPASWCDIVSIHPNVKACTYRELPDSWLLTFYPGRKEYQPPEEKRQVRYQYRVSAQQQGYLDIILAADAGPYGTKNHRMRFEAVPLSEKRTFVHVSYTYSDSAALRLAAKIYFATLGRGKVGFTVTGTDSNRNPEYIGGPRGALERSAVRYYFAIQSFMDTLHYPEERRFNMRISEWHKLTTRFRKQLFDLGKNEYITFKTAERKNQKALQRLIRNGTH